MIQDSWVLPDMMRHPLYPVFMHAIAQAMYGKGERHGGAVVPFLEQQWVHYAKQHGQGFLTGQAVKKIDEAVIKTDPQKFKEEILGAMVYAGMAILNAEKQTEGASNGGW